jgi:TonB-dependent SusC/RagA subfamily outer membrane receptor
MRKSIILATLLIFSFVQVRSQARQWDRPMQLKSCSIDIKADMFTATTFIEMEFCNPNVQEIEGLHRFELKPGQVITGFQLDLNGKYRDGSIEEKWKATNAYNSVVGKRIDPALLTMDYADHYSLHIYPVPAKGCRKVTMTIQQLLTPDKSDLLYLLPLLINDTVRFFKLNIAVNGNANPAVRLGLIADKSFIDGSEHHILSWNTENAILKNPVAFSIPVLPKTVLCAKTVDQQTYFALRLRPSFADAYEIHPKNLTVFWDASASLAKRDVNKEISFLKQFISFHNISRLTIIPFNYKLLDTAVFYTENNFNSRWQQYLQNINYDGATQLGSIDLTAMDADMFMLFTDGNNTYGKSKPKTGVALVYCVHTSNTANLATLQEIVGASGGKVIDLNKTAMSAAVATSSKAENWLLNITSASGKVITEQSLPMKRDQLLFINGTMRPGSDTLIFQYGNNNRVNNTERIVLNADQPCTGSAIDRVTMLNNFDRITRSYQWSSIIDYGLQEKIVTQNTAYIVLERVEDYIRYNIAPPKELEPECEKMNYVKRDTRFERKKLEELNEFDIVNNVVNVYNDRIRKWDPNERQISLNRVEFDKKDYGTAATSTENTQGQLNNQLSGNMPGLSISRSNALEEVVVVGYGTSMKKQLTGSVAYIRSGDIFSSARTVEQALQGRVAGLEITNTAGTPGSLANISIRGTSSINNNQPFYVLDGIPVSGNVNDFVNVNDIDNITVLKDINAAAIYGSRAANGAIVINTKRGRNYYNWYNNKPYRLKDMEDVEYLQELKEVPVSEKINVYERLREQYGGETAFYFDAAQHLFETGLKEKAFDILMNAAEAANGSQQVLIAMGYVLESWEQFDEAVKIYEQLIKSNTYNLNLYRDLAWAYYQQGNYQQAVDILYEVVKMNTGQQERINLYAKSGILADMNAIISLHKDQLAIGYIPASIIKALPVDMRISVECNNGNLSNVSINEPGGAVCSYSNPVTKNGGTIQQGYYWSYDYPFEYQIKKAVDGKYKVRVNYYDYYNYPGKIPSVIRIRTFKNFGKADQSISIENVFIDNQYGDIEIGEIKWKENFF